MLKRLITYLTKSTANSQLNALSKENTELKEALNKYVELCNVTTRINNYLQCLNTQLMIEIEKLNLENKTLTTTTEKMLMQLNGEFLPEQPPYTATQLRQYLDDNRIMFNKSKSKRYFKEPFEPPAENSSMHMGIDMADGPDESVTHTVRKNDNDDSN